MFRKWQKRANNQSGILPVQNQHTPLHTVPVINSNRLTSFVNAHSNTHTRTHSI